MFSQSIFSTIGKEVNQVLPRRSLAKALPLARASHCVRGLRQCLWLVLPTAFVGCGMEGGDSGAT